MVQANDQSFEPTVLSAVWRYRWLVLFLAVAFAGLGWLYASQTSAWSAEATLQVQDPRSSNLFDQGSRDAPDRYVEGQVAILRSRAVARRAVEIAGEQTPPIDVSVDEIVSGLEVGSSSSGDIVTLGYTAESQREAIGVVNAVSAAYQDIGRVNAEAQFAKAVRELDISIAELRDELAALDATIAERHQRVLADIESDPDRVAKQALVSQLTDELLALDAPSASSSDGRFSQFSSQLQVLSQRIDTLTNELDQERTNALAAERDDPERTALIESQGEAQRRLADLQSRRDQLAVDADLTGSGVVFSSPAETAEPSGAGLYLVLGLLLGLVIGAALAVYLANRHRRFATRYEPEFVLGTRLLADVPNFKEERVGSPLPVVDKPTSASAEAFRFVSASVSLQQMWPAPSDGTQNFRSVVTLSAGLSEGKTVVTANTGFAAAREGHNVLVVDADFGNQQLTQLLLGSGDPPLGMTNVVSEEVKLADVVIDIAREGAGSIRLLTRGTASVRAPDFFAAPATASFFESLSEEFDLILIDGPPLLRVAYASTLARLADRAMIVVAHGENIHGVEELSDQLDLIGIPLLGYVYNLAPLRPEMTVSAGSMADTLGEHPATVRRQE